MARLKEKMRQQGEGVWYKGKQGKTGNSLALRFEKALFQSHPEFSGEVRAHVIAPGRMLVVAEPPQKVPRAGDPVMEAFLSFLSTDISNSPQQIRTLCPGLTQRVDTLVRGVLVNPDEDLGD